MGGFPETSNALVKGVTPPPDFNRRPGALGKTNMIEAREAGAVKEAQLFDGQDTTFSLTASGDRFRDIVLAHTLPLAIEYEKCRHHLSTVCLESPQLKCLLAYHVE